MEDRKKKDYLEVLDTIEGKFWLGRRIGGRNAFFWGRMGDVLVDVRLIKTNLSAQEIAEVFWGSWRSFGWTPGDVKEAFKRGQYGF